MTPISLSVRPLRSVRWSFHAAALVEALLAAAVIALLWPAFQRVATWTQTADQRFSVAGEVVKGLPPLVLTSVCATHAALADPALRESLCRGARTKAAPSVAAPTAAMPAALGDALAQARRAFAAPLEGAQQRLRELRLQQREGIGDLRHLADEIAGIEADIAPLVARWQLIEDDMAGAGPAPLLCASRSIASSVGASPGEPLPAALSANATLLLAAALDGDPLTAPLAGSALLPPSSRAVGACRGQDLPQALAQTATLMAQARQAALEARKNEAMQALMRSAGVQWASAMALGLLLLNVSRSRMRPALGAALSLAAWAAMAWAARVPSPFAAGRVFELARSQADPWSAPSRLVIGLAAAAALLLLFALARPRRAPPAMQTMSTRLGYAGWVAASGIGWLLLLDLSVHGHIGNRYLALYHQGHLWLAMLVFSLMLFLRDPLGRAAAWTFSIVGEAARRGARRLGPALSAAAWLALAVGVAAAIALPLAHMRQLTSELGRVWVIVGAAWFFFLRGGPLAERLARRGTPLGSVLRYLAPLLFVALVLLAMMLLTHDMGPLLIAGYGAGAFVAASVAMWWAQRGAHVVWASLLALVLFVGWVALATLTLFKLGAVDPVTAARLESLAAPLASSNDQLALVQWFQQAAPPQGFGLGHVPWCGYASGRGCNGVPAQIHSDYSFTALVGAFGTMAAWVVSIGTAAWLHRLVRHHGRVTPGDPRLVSAAGRMTNDAQGFLSWIGVAWVVLTLCQLAVTVAGNMAVLPLTGVTFPFVSFGMTSLVVNMAFLALCINVSLPVRGRDA